MVTFSEFDYVKYIDEMAEYGLNFVRIQGGATPIDDSINYRPRKYPDILPWVRLPNGKYDLDQWNESYFKRLEDAVAYADTKGVVVDVVLFNAIGNWWLPMWRMMPLNPDLNDRIPPTEYLGTTIPYWFVTLENSALVEYQEKYVREVVKRLSKFDNVIYDVCDEPDAGVNSLPEPHRPVFLADIKLWIDRMLQVAHETDEALGNKHLIAETYATQIPDFSQDPRTGWVSLEYRAAIKKIDKIWDRNKPLGHIESTPIGLYPGNTLDAIRVESWETLAAGAASYLQFNDSCSVASPTCSDPNTAEIRENLRTLRKFISSFKFWEMTRNSEKISVAMSSEQSNAQYASQAKPGEQYSLYLHVSKLAGISYEAIPANYTANVTFQEVPAGEYQVEWLAPVSGRNLDAFNLTHPGGDLKLGTPGFEIDVAARVMALSVAKPVVSVQDLGVTASDGGVRYAQFGISRTGRTDVPLNVQFQVTRTSAVTGRALTMEMAEVVIPAGAKVATVPVSATDGSTGDRFSDARLRLYSDDEYNYVLGRVKADRIRF